ncbi:MAG TPA: type II secretion system protein [Chlamydiales bacterium]|nr:type II secretion system protein [Chlamydiales bacterium]
MNKKTFSLIEVMVAISLIAMVASAMGWKMYGMIAKKRFSSNMERLRSRLLTSRRLAMNMQSDWKGNLYFLGKEAHFSSQCVDDERVSQLPTLKLGSLVVKLNGEEMKNISFDFTSSGDISPQGKIQIKAGNLEPIDWNLSEIFSLEEGSKAGPAHPKDWSSIGKI